MRSSIVVEADCVQCSYHIESFPVHFIAINSSCKTNMLKRQDCGIARTVHWRQLSNKNPHEKGVSFQAWQSRTLQP